jgi:hypothetical protein
MAKKKKKAKDPERFQDYAQRVMEEYEERRFDDDEGTDEEEEQVPVINETYVQAFADEWQPEHDERLPHVRAFSMGELREVMHVYRTFDSKMPDPLPYYIAALNSHGFGVQMGFGGELVLLASQRNHSSRLLQYD